MLLKKKVLFTLKENFEEKKKETEKYHIICRAKYSFLWVDKDTRERRPDL